MNLFIVESPLQLLCAFEAISVNNEPYELLIRQTGRGLNDIHLLNCVTKLNLDYKFFLLRPDYFLIDFFKNIPLWLRVYMKKYNKIYFGSFYSSALKLIKKFLRNNNFLYLDDGAATLRAQFDIKHNKLKKVNWFTFFNLEPVQGQIIKKHSFSNLKSKFPKNKKLGIYFIGQPVEVMMGFERDDYIRCVNTIAGSMKDGEKLKYIPHRVEDIKHISNISNIEILSLDVPIELYFLSYIDKLPQKIYSCYSTALITLNSIFNDIDISSIKNKESKEILPELEVIYGYFKMNSISVISI